MSLLLSKLILYGLAIKQLVFGSIFLRLGNVYTEMYSFLAYGLIRAAMRVHLVMAARVCVKIYEMEQTILW